MNGNNLKNWIGFSAITLLAACGGGGSEPTNTTSERPQLISAPTLTSVEAAQISETNFRDITNLASTVEISALGAVDVTSFNVSNALKSSTNIAPLMDLAARAVTSTAVNCQSGTGSVQTSDGDGNPATSAAGDGRTGTYIDCFVTDILPVYIDGTFTNSIETVTGTLPELLVEPRLTATTPAFSFTATHTADIEIQLLFPGGFVMTNTATTKISSSFDGTTLMHSLVSTGDLSFGDTKTILVLRNQTSNATVTRLGDTSFDVSINYNVTVLSNFLNGSISISTLTPMHAINHVIQSGSVRVTGANNSSLTATIIADNTAQVEADFNGDGVVDRTETLVLDRQS